MTDESVMVQLMKIVNLVKIYFFYRLNIWSTVPLLFSYITRSAPRIDLMGSDFFLLRTGTIINVPAENLTREGTRSDRVNN